jgi:serine/threonine-protein kinase
VAFGAKRVAETPQTLPVGTRLGDGGRYEVRQRIGIGGMAEVYRGVDTRLGNRIVAIKTFSTGVAQHPYADRMRSLFIQEAQALSRVKDENVVDVLDFGAAPDGTPYMVMEFLHGNDLGVFLRKSKQVAIDQAVDIVLGVCAGVHACHLAGIIHRDLKPANIFLTRTSKGEEVKVLDFSVAKVPIARPEAPSADQAKTDLIVGTPTYMSPEQAVGRPANELSDQYSIGALLYRCVTGRTPQGVLPKPRDLRADMPERLEATILRAMDATPGKRFGTVHDLGQALLPFASSAGRSRWRGYFRTPPLPLDPTTTGSIPLGAVRSAQAPIEPSVPSAPATVAANYDFKAHERTTKLDSEARRARALEGSSPTKPTTVDNVVPFAPPEPSSVAPSSIIVPISEASVAGPGQNLAPMSRVGVEPSSMSRVRSRRTFIAAFALIVVVVFGVTIAGLRASRHHDVARPKPLAPEWTREAAPVAPPVIEPTPRPAVPPTKVVPPPNPAAAPAAEQELGGTRAPAPVGRPKHHRRSPRTNDSIQYGPDGLPILH